MYFNLWDCFVILLLAAAVWVGIRVGFAAQLYPVLAVFGGVASGCVFYGAVGRLLMGPLKLEAHSANYWGFVVVALAFVGVLSPLQRHVKKITLKIPMPVDAALGATASVGLALCLIGFTMLTVAWSPWADIQERVEQTSFTGPLLTPRWPSVYVHVRNPNAVHLRLEASEAEFTAEQELHRKSGTLKVTPKK